jgi:choline-sulfatase
VDAVKKNVVIVSFDDAIAYWRYKTVFGAELQTPNLDKVCATSTAFHAAYCQSPLCGPSRASFMSASSPHKTKLFNNDIKTFEVLKPADMWSYQLKQNGYFCSSGGKVHHGYKPLPQKIHDALYSDERKFFPIDLKRRTNIETSLAGGVGGGISTTDPADDSIFYDSRSADSFIDFISNYEGEQPFYREVGFFSPHTPFITPVRFKKMYKLADFTYPDEWDEEVDASIETASSVRTNFKTYKSVYWKKSVRNYFAALSHGDYHLGRIWDALQSSPHGKDTIVVILTDHGLHLGEKRRFGKSTLLEQVANVPFIIHDPENPEAKDVYDPVALMDVGPTILNMVDLPPLTDCIAKSLVPLMKGEESWPDRAIPTLQAASASVRKGPYRFIRHENGDTEFYDIKADWWQKKPLGPDHPDFDEVRQAHLACCKEYGLDFNSMPG